MDILYVIGNRLSEWYNNELRYSLRCLERNGMNVGKVYVVGYRPAFLDVDAVTFLQCKDTTSVKHYNIQNCIDYAVKNSDIGARDDGWFLLSSDDHFYIQATDFATYPKYWRGVQLPKEADNTYHRTLLSTRELLTTCGLPCNHLAWHGNTWFNTKVWRSEEFQRILRWALTMPEGCEPTCLMLNYMLGKGMLSMDQFTARADSKFKGDCTNEQVADAVASREVVSSTDNIERSALGRYLQTKYRQPSKYEQL